MSLKEFGHLKRKNIYPGEFFASSNEIIISTLLGSCVAACLYDSVNRVFGMNHFLLSSELYQSSPNGFITPSGRYGVQAMELLINRMFRLGADRKHIKAKAFGGATLKGLSSKSQTWNSIGLTNAAFIKDFLAIENIPLVAQDLGGDRGRTIYFVPTDYSVFVKKHETVNLEQLLEKENQYNSAIKREQQTKKDDISLWN